MSLSVSRLTKDSPKPGRITVSVSEYHAMLDAATPRHRAQLLGHSPGKAAQLAGITPQAIYRAINRGTLEAFEVRHDDTGELAWLLVTDTSLRDYIQRNRHRRA
jgi:hypothetical protein